MSGRGTTNLSGALEVATRRVKIRQYSNYKRRLRHEFLDFMNEIFAERRST